MFNKPYKIADFALDSEVRKEHTVTDHGEIQQVLSCLLICYYFFKDMKYPLFIERSIIE